MRSSHSLAILVVILGVFFLGGCGMNDRVGVTTGTHVVTVMPSPNVRITESIEPTRTKFDTLTPNPSPTTRELQTESPSLDERKEQLEENQLPPLLVSISSSKSKASVSTCRKSETTRIYYVPTEEEIELLLSDPEINYKFPSWAPDGKSVAFIKSSLNSFDVGPNNEIDGLDSIWILDIKTRKQERITDEMPNLYEINEYGCRAISFINGPLRWSQDGKYMVFSYYGNKIGYLQYYLVDMDTKEIIKLPIDQSLVTPTWIPGRNAFVTVDRKSIRVFGINSSTEITQKIIDFPIEMLWYQMPEWVHFGGTSRYHNSIEFLDESTIIGTFHLVSRRSRDDLSTWTLNLDTREWNIIFPDDQFRGPIIGRGFSISCGNRIVFLRNEDWRVVKSIEGYSSGRSICTGLSLFQSNSGEELVSFVDFDQDKIVVHSFTDDEEEIVPFDISNITYPGNYKYIVDYAWMLPNDISNHQP
jgi:hypothetical protein